MNGYRRRSEDPPRGSLDRAGRKRLARLLRLAGPEKGPLALGTVFLLAGSGLGLAYPQVIRFMVDEALANASLALVDQAAAIIFAIFCAQGVAVALRYYLFTYAGERIVARLRRTLYDRIIAQEIGFFDQRRTGELMSRLASDATVIQNAASVNISMGLRNAVQAAGAVGLLFYTSARLTLLMLVVVPPVVLGARFTGRALRKLSRRVQDALADAGEVAEETIAGVRTVRAFAQEGYEAARYGEAIDRALTQTRQRIRFAAIFQGGASTAAYTGLAIILWYGGRLVIDGGLTIGELTSFLLYTMTVAFSLGSLAYLWTSFMSAIGASERVFEVMDRTPQIPTEGGRTLDDLHGRVDFDNVTFCYPSRPEVTVLDGLELTIEPGEKVALVGPSGAGKSTVASLIPRFYDPASGRVCIDGHDLRDLDPTWLRQRIGIVPQEPILFSTSIAANIRYGLEDASDAEVEAAAKSANAHEFIESFPDGYDTAVGERGVQLSGGQKQRVAIARALLRNPRILILDEATSALDAESEALVQEALERLMEGRSTLIIAHRLSTVINADRVAVIDSGRLVQSGPHRELLDAGDGLYKRLVERQFATA